MCIRDRVRTGHELGEVLQDTDAQCAANAIQQLFLCDRPRRIEQGINCLLYTSDAADERSSVDLGGRRIIKKKKKRETM